MGNFNDWLEKEGWNSKESESEYLAWESKEREKVIANQIKYTFTHESSEEEVRAAIRVPNSFDKGVWIAERDEWNFSGPHEECIMVIFWDGNVKALYGAQEGEGYHVREWKP